VHTFKGLGYFSTSTLGGIHTAIVTTPAKKHGNGNCRWNKS